MISLHTEKLPFYTGKERDHTLTHLLAEFPNRSLPNKVTFNCYCLLFTEGECTCIQMNP
jgi:hypothetical protein